MEVKVLEEKVQNAAEKVKKCKKTIERHNNQLTKKLAKVERFGVTLENLKEKRETYRGSDHSWELYEVESKVEDIKGATKKLAEAERVLSNWEHKLTTEVNKEKFIEGNTPQVIKEFLENWKQQAHEWYLKRYEDYKEFARKLDKKVAEARKELGFTDVSFHNRQLYRKLEEIGLNPESVKKKKANFAGPIVIMMITFKDKAKREAWLEKELEAEKKRKMFDLIFRINDVVGEITDASGLEINEKLNLDGIVIGTKGKAKVETIGAGGWNVQVFHYRTLVHEIKGGK